MTPTERFDDAVAAAREVLDGLPDDVRQTIERTLDLTFEEWIVWNDRRALAQAGGVIDADLSRRIYAATGGPSYARSAGDGWAPDADLALRYSVTILMGKLLRLAVSA
jgi:hypothetical protein